MKKTLKAFNFVGYKKSGKTSLIKAIIPILQQQGIKVGVVKFSHQPFDREGTDTNLFTQLGCKVLGLNEQETFLIWPQKKYLRDLLGLLEVDIVLIEGGKSLTWLPRIIVPSKEQDLVELDNGLAMAYFSEHTLNSQLQHLSTAKEVASFVWKHGFTLPGLDCGDCGASCLDIAKKIIYEHKSIDLCKSLTDDEMEIFINGERLVTKSFVKDFIKGALVGMLAQLKGWKPGEIEIKFKV
ncbi:MAG: molybdopterin-guanine dinucleotide biosynthesis protein MobB [Desulfonauticus sp.]|nr:molybdopterin-guanine dinucleotide biosynthesis protein MobB [Desulfonauticus sp.]